MSRHITGCSNSKYLDAHHIKHWIDGGETNADNIAMLCSRHHTLLHDGHYSIRMKSYGEVVFLDRHNEVIEPAVFPQFPVSPRNFNGLKVSLPPAGQVLSPSILERNSERDLVEMLHFREKWGRRKSERIWDQVMRSFERKTQRDSCRDARPGAGKFSEVHPGKETQS